MHWNPDRQFWQQEFGNFSHTRRMKVASALLVFLFGSTFAAWNFKPLTSQDKCLTMPGNNLANQATFSIGACTAGNTFQQLWDTSAGNPSVMLLPFSSPSCAPTAVAVNTTAGTGNGAPIVAAAFDPGSKPQYWTRVTPTFGGLPDYFWYKNLATGNCMTMQNGGTSVDNWECSDWQTHQMWSQSAGDQSVANGGNVLKNQQFLGTQCLNVKNYNPNAGATFYAQICDTASFAQNFQVINSQAKTWMVYGSYKCMDGNTLLPAPFQYPCTATAQNHQWIEFYYSGDTTGTHFMNVFSGWCLTWNPSNLNDVHTEACVKGNTNQQWVRTAV